MFEKMRLLRYARNDVLYLLKTPEWSHKMLNNNMQTEKLKEIAISIIIPHFNGREILGNCLNSLLKNSLQKYKNQD